jgi:hypothetical protein
MHGAGPTQSDAATELRAGQADDIAQSPQERHVIRDIEIMLLFIDQQRHH